LSVAGKKCLELFMDQTQDHIMHNYIIIEGKEKDSKIYRIFHVLFCVSMFIYAITFIKSRVVTK